MAGLGLTTTATTPLFVVRRRNLQSLSRSGLTPSGNTNWPIGFAVGFDSTDTTQANPALVAATAVASVSYIGHIVLPVGPTSTTPALADIVFPNHFTRPVQAGKAVSTEDYEEIEVEGPTYLVGGLTTSSSNNPILPATALGSLVTIAAGLYRLAQTGEWATHQLAGLPAASVSGNVRAYLRRLPKTMKV